VKPVPLLSNGSRKSARPRGKRLSAESEGSDGDIVKASSENASV
jgi:hypothetical protein